jgi:N-hydroxyarylamine O-acetyltransferase
MTNPLDRAAYFARIGFSGPTAPDLATLTELVRLHTEAIPFENLEVLAGGVPKLDLQSLQDKLIARRRGGYCFEQNALFLAVLRDIGFAAEGLVARVRLGVAPAVSTGRTHMMLRVTLDGATYLADVGFGAMVPTAPLRLDGEGVQHTPTGPYRVLAAGADRTLQGLMGDVWEDLYRFDPLPAEPADYVIGNFYSATWPGGTFTGNLVLSRPHDGERRTMRNARFTRRRHGAAPVIRILATRDEFASVLREQFGIEPSDTELDAAIATAATDTPHPTASFF